MTPRRESDVDQVRAVLVGGGIRNCRSTPLALPRVFESLRSLVSRGSPQSESGSLGVSDSEVPDNVEREEERRVSYRLPPGTKSKKHNVE